MPTSCPNPAAPYLLLPTCLLLSACSLPPAPLGACLWPPAPVEELFRRFAKVLHLHAGGQVIRTTAEHPFYAKGTGWTPARALRAGDEVWTDDGRWVGVEEVYDTGEYEPVYNLRVADWHTYIVRFTIRQKARTPENHRRPSRLPSSRFFRRFYAACLQ